MGAQQIIKEIQNLPPGEKQEIYDYLLKMIRKREHVLQSLEKIRGIGKGLWDKDAQEYINELRDDNRF